MNPPFEGDPVDCSFQGRQGPILVSHLLDAYERGFDKGRASRISSDEMIVNMQGRERELESLIELDRLRGIEKRLDEKFRSVSGNPDSLYTSAKQTYKMLRYIQTGEDK